MSNINITHGTTKIIWYIYWYDNNNLILIILDIYSESLVVLFPQPFEIIEKCLIWTCMELSELTPSQDLTWVTRNETEIEIFRHWGEKNSTGKKEPLIR